MDAMGVPRKLLGSGESEVLHLRTHPKVLIGPAALLLLLGAAFGVGVGAMPGDAQPWGTYAVVLLTALATLTGCVVPFLRWRTSTYTITDRRIIARSGIVSRDGHDLPLLRIVNVSYHRSLMDRLFGCGTLIIQTAGGEPVTLPDVPDVERVHRIIGELLFAETTPALPVHWEDG